MMNSEVDVHAYVQDLEKHLQLTLFGGRIADPEGAVLLVRGALAEGDSERAENLADATRRPDRYGLEDAGRSWVVRGNQRSAEALLRQAYALYEELGSAEGAARVRAWLRTVGTRLCHWTHADRPAFGWDSLTDTERTIAGLVAQGLSNRQVASRVFLSTHTVAFHLRHVFWKLGVTSRVQLARMSAEQAATGS